MRQAANALLAVPISLIVLVGVLLRRSATARIGVAITLTVVLGVGLFAAGRAAPTVAIAPQPIVPLTQAAFKTIVATDRGLKDPVTITFSTPMDAASVAASLKVEPATAVNLDWAPDAMTLSIAPRTRWSAGVLQTVTVQAGALARTGQPLARPARSVFLTRGATTGTAAPTETIGTNVALTTGFVVTFARPVDAASVQTAIRLDPPAPGVVRESSPTDAQGRFTFQPAVALRSDVDYKLIVAGVRDADGVPLDTIELAVHTTTAPGVVRFRPRTASANVPRASVLSVRFTQPMDERSTMGALSVTVAGRAIKGKTHWTENDKVLVFTPSATLPAGKTVLMTVTTAATNTAGVPLTQAQMATFKTTKASATTKAATSFTISSGSRSSSGGGGKAVGGGSWAAVETYYLGLMNCTRTGGWVTSSGHCSSPGGRSVAPLRLDSGISSKVSRPYAKRLATGADCSHFLGGNPGTRLRSAGYSNYTWAENIGCRSGGAKSAVLATHMFYQSEKSYGGGHYVNLMNPKYDRVGIGVWVSGGRVRLVIDFYHP